MKTLQQVLSEFDFRKDVSRAKDIISWSWDKAKEIFTPIDSLSAIPAAYFFAVTSAGYMLGKSALRGGSVGAATGAVIAYALGNDVAAGAGGGALYGVTADMAQQAVRGLVSTIRESRTEARNHQLM